MVSVDRNLARHFDWGLFTAIMLVPLAGMIVLYSSGYDPEVRSSVAPWLQHLFPSPALVRQIVFLGAGLCVMAVAIAAPQQWLFKASIPLYTASTLALVLVLFFGTVINGSRRWFDLGVLNLQPAEFVKLGVILAMARFIAARPPSRGGYTLKQLVIPLAMIGVPMVLILKQPDLGTALAVGGVGGAMLLFAGISRRCLVGFAIVILLSLYPAWSALHDYQRQRILTLFNPEADARGSGYHIIQSIIAVGSGGATGKGFMQGTQAHLEFLPEHSTDFIFSVLAEEWGFMGCFAVILLYSLLMYRLIRVVSRCKELFGAMVVVGVSSLVLIHVLVNIGMVIGLLPVVGIPLILFSYGGSSLIATMFSLGLVLGISMRRLSYLPKR